MFSFLPRDGFLDKENSFVQFQTFLIPSQVKLVVIIMLTADFAATGAMYVVPMGIEPRTT